MNDELLNLRRGIQQLDELHQAGMLSADGHGSARAELEKAIVALVLAKPAPAVDANTAAPSDQPPSAPLAGTPAPTPAPDGKGASRGLLIGIALFAFAAGGAGYWWAAAPNASSGSQSTPVAASAAAGGPTAPHPLGNDAMASMVQALADRLKAQPADAEGWAMLARSYANLGRHGDALAAYAKAVALRKDDAALLADYADELALQQGRRLAGEPMSWVKQALAVDPNQPKALLLAGTEAFDRQDYALAITHWTRVVQFGPPESELVKQARAGLDDARRQSGQPAVVADGSAAAAPKGPLTTALSTAGFASAARPAKQ
ncbi:tetratricopeptide repeat protein [Caenimonas koreensis]|uniref:Tetratricopeptide repeat protein n=1 Tax=Caenimonas koreensis DSM 17982 TaxID=1121255 RepID=A0A844B137_9BURK|nr:tetratricopeptide repeat protein [Caenimonas koreensis]MRD47002.1 tetratricopeptide repeat protein [Caenimonas koreensis DSM 17982]